jgi:hypothetical protein
VVTRVACILAKMDVFREVQKRSKMGKSTIMCQEDKAIVETLNQVEEENFKTNIMMKNQKSIIENLNHFEDKK